MTAAKVRRKVLQLRVAFDTSVLYNNTETYLVNRATEDLLGLHRRHSDMPIRWCLPEVVRNERVRQMRTRAGPLVRHAEALGRLMDKDLGITASTIDQLVGELVGREVKRLGLEVVPLDFRRVDWRRIVHDSCFRRPPFQEAGKGFRDALICETFIQLVERSPKSPRSCQSFLVATDKLMLDAIEPRIETRTNVKIASSVEELSELISTLVSDVTAEYIAGLQPIAAAYFYQPGDETSLFYRKGIQETIARDFYEQLHHIPVGWNREEIESWDVDAPRFVNKVDNRVYWSSRVKASSSLHWDARIDMRTGSMELHAGELALPSDMIGVWPLRPEYQGSIFVTEPIHVTGDTLPDNYAPVRTGTAPARREIVFQVN